MAIHSTNSAFIYGVEGEPSELLVYPSQELKIQAVGAGSYRVYGKLTQDSAAKPLMLINASNFETTDTADGENLYTCDVSGLHSIFAGDVSGVTMIYAAAYATT